MLDLDELPAIGNADLLYAQLAIALWLDSKIGYYDWYRIVHFFDIDHIVEWSDQRLSDKLVDALIGYYRNPANKHWLHSVMHFSSCCVGNYTEAQQDIIAELIMSRVHRKVEK